MLKKRWHWQITKLWKQFESYFIIIRKMINTIEKTIPIQGCTLHVACCDPGPSQVKPPWTGDGLSHVRCLFILPSPQVTLHVDHAAHEAHRPSTETNKDIFFRSLVNCQYGPCMRYLRNTTDPQGLGTLDPYMHTM